METEEKKHRTGLGAQTLYGMGEFMNGGAFVIINTFFTVFMITGYASCTCRYDSIGG